MCQAATAAFPSPASHALLMASSHVLLTASPCRRYQHGLAVRLRRPGAAGVGAQGRGPGRHPRARPVSGTGAQLAKGCCECAVGSSGRHPCARPVSNPTIFLALSCFKCAVARAVTPARIR